MHSAVRFPAALLSSPPSPAAGLAARLPNPSCPPWMRQGPGQESGLLGKESRVEAAAGIRRGGSLLLLISCLCYSPGCCLSALLPHREPVRRTARARRGPAETSCCRRRSAARGCSCSRGSGFSPKTGSLSPPSTPSPPRLGRGRGGGGKSPCRCFLL